MHRSLDELERWFQGEIVRPHEGKSAPRTHEHDATRHAGSSGASKHTAGTAADWILPSRHLRPQERVAIYADMYFARLVEALRTDFPVVAHFAGPKSFERLTRAYLRRFPSRHYSLNMLGHHLPEFLDGPVRIPRRALLADVARVELAMTRVFDLPATTSVAPEALAALAPSEWISARLKLVEALELVTLQHRANAIVSAVRQQLTMPDSRPTPTWVAVYRKGDVVWRADLTRPMFEALCALKRGETLGDALVASAAVFEGEPAELHALVGQWFRDWTAEGLFTGIETAG